MKVKHIALGVATTRTDPYVTINIISAVNVPNGFQKKMLYSNQKALYAYIIVVINITRHEKTIIIVHIVTLY